MSKINFLDERKYTQLASGIGHVLQEARRQAARAVNSIATAAYWEVGRRIVEFEQKGRLRAQYGSELLKRLSADLTERNGRGYGLAQVKMMRQFYLAYPRPNIGQSAIGQSDFSIAAKSLPLSWTQYTLLLRVSDPKSRKFYEMETLRGGWSVRQLHRQIESQFYERTVLSRNKSTVLKTGTRPQPEDVVTPEEEIKNPYILEFLGLKDEYSESELEDGLIRRLESFLLELGSDYTFVARQKRLRVGDAWYRVDLVFYHRKLRCLILIDLKLGSFTHADAGQMHLYLNYAREHWTHADENPPVGLILCAKNDAAVAHYALEGLPNKIMASEYRMVLPKERTLAKEIKKTSLALKQQKARGELIRHLNRLKGEPP